ncbi:MAG: NAD(P)H-dependent oxidoreductase [Bdellovibrionota bacterium]
MKTNSLLILNGSPNGKKSNCNNLIKLIQKSLSKSLKTKVIHLVEKQKNLDKEIHKASGFIFVTGTYWDSWGSPMQKFLENATDLEGTPAFVGKPSAVFVLNHSVGGKAVLSRLQGVLSTFGCLIPPMSGMVYSLVTKLALKNSKSIHKDDLWTVDDIPMILENFKLALEIKTTWKAWPVDRKNFRKNWL